MSRLTHGTAQGKRIILIFTAFQLFLSPSIGKASPVSDAQEKLNKAYDDYYDAVSKGGNKTPEEQKALRQKIVEPAMSNLNQAMKQETDEVVKEHAKDLPPSLSGPAFTTQSGPGAPAQRERAPDPTLDASDVPRELEFPGKPKAAPSAVPKVEPYSGPYAPKSQ
jgi:hypothetical protein